MKAANFGRNMWPRHTPVNELVNLSAVKMAFDIYWLVESCAVRLWQMAFCGTTTNVAAVVI
jgi:hypothetical protein